MADLEKYSNWESRIRQHLADDNVRQMLDSIDILRNLEGVSRILSKGNLSALPESARNQFMASLKPVLVNLDGWVANQDDENVSKLKANFDAFYNKYAGALFLIHFINSSELEVSAVREVAAGFFNEFRESFGEDLSRNIKESENILSVLRGHAETQGITLHTEDFKTNAKNAKIMSGIWAGTSVFIGSVILAIAFGTRWHPDPTGVPFYFLDKDVMISAMKYDFLAAVAQKILIFGVLVTFLLVSIRLLRSSINQYYINTHRQIALESLSKFAASASESEFRFSIVIEIIRQIFCFHPTGLFDDKTESGSISISETLQNLRNATTVKRNVE